MLWNRYGLQKRNLYGSFFDKVEMIDDKMRVDGKHVKYFAAQDRKDHFTATNFFKQYDAAEEDTQLKRFETVKDFKEYISIFP